MRGLLRSLKASLWFMALTFPLICVRVDTSTAPPAVSWRLMNALYLGLGVFLLSFVWRAMLARKGDLTPEEADMAWLFRLLLRPRIRAFALALLYLSLWSIPLGVAWYEKRILAAPGLIPLLCCGLGLIQAILVLSGRAARAKAGFSALRAGLARTPTGRAAPICAGILFCALLPLWLGAYETKVLTQALIWIALGLGLNIIVGQTGLLALGYMAFYAVGAYTYGIINHNLPLIGFWPLLPLGGLFAIIAGLVIGVPVLRLRGDYLAIVTLGFGEIMNQVLTNMVEITGGANGIAGIPKPSFFGLALSPARSAIYVYYLALLLALLTIAAVGRLGDSRLGRSWMALREDETAC
jgi:branched-chain amino acid transport system permease protein